MAIEDLMRISPREFRDGMIGAVCLSGWLWLGSHVAVQAETCQRCGWTPPQTQVTVTVRTMSELRKAVGRAKPGTTLLLEDGVYHLDGTRLDIPVSDLVLRGKQE